MTTKRVTHRQNSLYTGFEGYRTPSDSEYKDVVKSGLVAFDANALLNLYRYNSGTREDLFRVLEALGNRIWAPHQVIKEFWRNREGAIRDPVEVAERTLSELEEYREQSLKTLRTWANRIALPHDRLKAMQETITASFSAVAEEVDRFNATVSSLDTNTDPVLAKLNVLFEGRVGQPMVDQELEEVILEAERRILAEEPPGYKDAKKGVAANGDYLVWAQVVKEAVARSCDVLLVTGDVKEDWWRKERGEVRGPRLELVEELRRSNGRSLYMLRPESFLLKTKEVLKVTVSEESVQDIERVDRITLLRQLPDYSDIEDRSPLEKLPGGQSGDYLSTLIDMTRLAENSPTLDVFLNEFQKIFPSITLRDVARRRMRVLISLGLAEIAGNKVLLTRHGRELLSGGGLPLVQSCFLSRIAGALEVKELAVSNTAKSLRRLLHNDPPAGLSATQAMLLLRWMQQLDLIP